MIENMARTALTIARIPNGGFLIREVVQSDGFPGELFACSTVDEALDFIKKELGAAVE